MSNLKAKPPEETKPGKTKMLVFGASGVGKTIFSISFGKSPYVIDTEGGADLRHYQEKIKSVGGVYLGPQDGALDFDFVIGQMKALSTEKHEFGTLVIDSITKLYQTCIANEAERLGDKDAFGASKKPAIANMRRLVNWMMKLDMNILLVAHEASEWGVDAKTGQRQEIGKIADVWDKLIYELDLTLQAVKRGPARLAVVRKSRLTGFPDGETFPLDYAEFASRYGKDFIESKHEIITLAKPEQVQEISRLTGILKTDPETVQKWLTKAGAENFSEFTEAQAAAVIKSLNKTLNPDAK